jgi:hypothetical protein
VSRVFLLVLLAAAVACGSSPTSPDQTGPVRLTAQINRTEITTGGTAVVSFRLENVTANPITLNFPSGCQVQPFIAKRPSNDVIYPGGGGWVCPAVVTSLTLAPHSVSVTELNVGAGAAAFDIVSLAPGEYSFFARVESREHTLESPRVTLTVR